MNNWKCGHCEHIFENLTASKKANHSRWCEFNPKRKNYVEALSNRISEMNKARVESGRLNQFLTDVPYTHSQVTINKIRKSATGRKHSTETREKISISSRKSKHRRLMRYTRKYTMKNGNEILLDSSWEEALARRLDSLNVDWVRPAPISWTDSNGKSHNYFPDFYLKDFDIYLDPKNGAAYLNQIEKINVIRNLYKNVIFLHTLKECNEYTPL